MSARRERSDKYNRLASLKTSRQSSSQIKLISHHEPIDHQRRRRRQTMTSQLVTGSGKLRKLIRWSLVHLCLPLCLVALLLVYLAKCGHAQTLEGARFKRNSLLMPISELRISGSKLEPPSRPSVDWSKQRPHFGPNIERNVSVELGKTAHLACKVFELGDKTVSWLRPRENEILTAGKYTYIGDSRISSMNEPGSHDWILEIKDVKLNDSTSYECQVSTDPKMSLIINLNVQAARARIKPGENNYYPLGGNIEFVCEILPPSSSHSYRSQQQQQQQQQLDNHQIYWYHNGNLINYARSSGELSQSTSRTIDFDSTSQTSRLKLHNIQLTDAGNYTCKPTAAEPATVKLFVKKPRNRMSNQAQSLKDSHRNRQQQQQQQHGLVISNSLELSDQANQVQSSSASTTTTKTMTMPTFVILLFGLLLSCLQFNPTQHFAIAAAAAATTLTLLC